MWKIRTELRRRLQVCRRIRRLNAAIEKVHEENRLALSFRRCEATRRRECELIRELDRIRREEQEWLNRAAWFLQI